MNVILAPDSFKGCLTAMDVCLAMEKGISKALPNVRIIKVPMADGGEGTLTSLITATNGTVVEVTDVADPLGRPITACYGVMGDQKTAIIELASASGLHHLRHEELNPNVTTSYGTGQLIRHALDAGYQSFIVCLGGSATNDGGTGLLKALGFRFLNQYDQEIEDGGLSLCHLSRIDLTKVDPRLKRCTFKMAADVTNPLVGPNGASRVFAPQKGASNEDVLVLDKVLTHFADVVERQMKIRVHDLNGAGAAGGTAAGMTAFLNAEWLSGIELVKKSIGFDSILEKEQPHFILTGEGKIDAQTGFGKVITGIAESGKKKGIPVIALAGAISGDLQPLHEMGLTAAFAITDGPMSVKESVQQANVLIENFCEQLFRTLKTLPE